MARPYPLDSIIGNFDNSFYFCCMEKLLNGYIERLKAFEGFSAKAYKPKGEKPGAYYTVGYGHYGVKEDCIVTKERAHSLLLEDVSKACEALRSHLGDDVIASLSSGQYTALVDFVFNLGIGTFRRSTLCKKVLDNACDVDIATEFLRWVYSGNRKLQGLVIRRSYNVGLWML